MAGTPDTWNIRIVAPERAPEGIVAGAALNRVGDHVVALAIREPGNHAGFLVRWRADDLSGGRLDAAEWWTGAKGWVSGGDPAVVLDDAGPESSIHHDARLNRWIHVRTEGFGASTIAVSSAPRVEGPWSSSVIGFRPPESDRPRMLVYAAKGHPRLEGADVVVTYATNTFDDFGALVRDTSIYYPRFVRLSLSR